MVKPYELYIVKLLGRADFYAGCSLGGSIEMKGILIS